MKRFSAILLFTIIWAILFFAMGSLCNGAESRLTISELLLPQSTSCSSEVHNTTDAEFFQWATNQNDKTRVEWEEWYKTAPPRWTSYGVTIDYQQSRRGSYFGSNYEQGSVHRYQQRYLNPDYISRPLTVINPYCRPKRQITCLDSVEKR